LTKIGLGSGRQAHVKAAVTCVEVQMTARFALSQFLVLPKFKVVPTTYLSVFLAGRGNSV
jgi:hypothetical protein